MGRGIAQVMAKGGYSAILYELNPAALQKARQDMSNELLSLADKGKITITESREIFQRIRFTDLLQDCKADLIIEAIVEDVDIKSALFDQLGSLNGEKAIYTTNTSSIPVSRLAAAFQYPERLAGLHFFNPAPVMKLVEIVGTASTTSEITGTLRDLCKNLGKTPVICKDAPGFIVNRVARPYYIESLKIAEESGADTKRFSQIDRLLESSGFRMGPFKLMDLIGNDVNYAVSCSIYDQLEKPERLKPSPIQKEKVDQGALGRKTQAGYYDYHQP
jgi:3-hydroxybutyryl-CoA dehydrogenase